MRDAAFLLAFLPMPALALGFPWIGVVLWVWLSLVQPHHDLWSFAATIPYVLIMALATLIGLLFAKDRFRPRLDATSALLLLLLAMATVSTVGSLAPDLSWPKWQEYWKNMLMVLLFGAALNSRVRFHTAVWLLAACLGYYGAMGGMLFILTAGAHNFEGPPGSAIADRNNLALAMTMAIPLLHYLAAHSRQHLIRVGLLVAIGLTVLAVLGTYSRGGFIGLVAMGGVFWLRSRRKTLTLLLLLPIVAGVWLAAPAQWVERMRTIQTADQEDESFRSRLLSWQAHLEAAKARPYVGAGIYALNDREVFFRFVPQVGAVDVANDTGRAAHSIYFQVIGEMGLLAFAVYIALAATVWRSTFRVIRLVKGRTDLTWMGDLARVCQASLTAFFVTGASLSMAFYELYLLEAVLLAALCHHAECAVAVPARVAQDMRHRHAAPIATAATSP